MRSSYLDSAKKTNHPEDKRMSDTTCTMPTSFAVSPLLICEQVLTLAQDAERAGRRGAAQHLLELVSEVLEPVMPAQPVQRRRR
jgi:hypothetical protein